ncbi:MAG: hypothetical protein OHK0013_39160 [Sandaracinaceae bacterium]
MNEAESAPDVCDSRRASRRASSRASRCSRAADALERRPRPPIPRRVLIRDAASRAEGALPNPLPRAGEGAEPTTRTILGTCAVTWDSIYRRTTPGGPWTREHRTPNGRERRVPHMRRKLRA